MFTINIIIHTCKTRAKQHLTWNRSELLTCRKYVKICHLVRRPCRLVRDVVKIKTWLEMWIPKLQLNLGPIISAPAAKGNFSTSPHYSHHLWGLGLWRHTRGILLLKSDGMSRSFVPVFRLQKAHFVSKMHILPLAILASSMFFAELSVQPQTSHWHSRTRAWNAHLV